jgi:hypothetical protein
MAKSGPVGLSTVHDDTGLSVVEETENRFARGKKKKTWLGLFGSRSHDGQGRMGPKANVYDTFKMIAEGDVQVSQKTDVCELKAQGGGVVGDS